MKFLGWCVDDDLYMDSYHINYGDTEYAIGANRRPFPELLKIAICRSAYPGIGFEVSQRRMIRWSEISVQTIVS